MPEDKPFPLPPREMRDQLGIPEDIDEGTIQDLFYGKPAPPINMQEMFSPLQAGREALPTAVEAGALVGGGILAGGGGVPGMIAAGGLNVFGRHLANKMRALNEGQILPDRANPAAVSTDFILGAAQAMVPVAKGSLGFIQQGLTQAGIGQAENLVEGKPLSMQQAGESALMGAGMHGGFQAAGKLAGKVLPLRTEATTPSPVEGQRAPLTTMLAGERGAALMGNLKPPTPDQMGFYSRLKHFADNLPDNAAHNPLALANQLQKGVTSKLELDETGVLPWLREQKGKVTSQQVRDYVDQHQIKVEEKVLGEGAGISTAEYKRWQDLDNRYSNLSKAEYEEYDSLSNKIIERTSSGISQPTKWNRPETLTPFEHGAEPGSYRELVMTLPTEHPERQRIIDRLNEISEMPASWHREHPEAVKEFDRLVKERDRIPKPQSFTSSHYSDIPNPLLHMRFDSRISPDGKKTLFLHEIQSDWHQKAHDLAVEAVEKTGLHKGDPGYSAAVTKMIPRMYKTSDIRATKAENKGGYWEVTDRHGDFITNVYDTSAMTEVEAIAEANRRIDVNSMSTSLGGKVPNAPLKQTPEWTSLGLKRLLRYAAENGYDRIAWTPGEAQAERYDMSKHVDSIKWYNPQGKVTNPVGVREVTIETPGETVGINLAVDSSGKVVTGTHTHFNGKNLSEIIGKDLAGKIMADEHGSIDKAGIKVLSREGQGQVGFYGSPEKESLGIVGGVMNDLGKKWGARVGTSGIPTGKEGVTNFYAEKTPNGKYAVREVGNQEGGGRYYRWVKTGLDEDTAKKMADEMKAGVGHKVHSLDLPDSLKQDVKQKGQPIASISDIFPMKERQA